jgi:hypothetical protein
VDDGWQKIPVSPVTRAGTGVIGLFVGAMAGIPIPVLFGGTAGTVVWVLLAAAGAVRGGAVTAHVGPGGIWFRNLFWSQGVEVAEIESLRDLRGSGMLNAAVNPALQRHGRLARKPIHAAMLWGTKLTGHWSRGDRRRAQILVAWADAVKVPVSKTLRSVIDA